MTNDWFYTAQFETITPVFTGDAWMEWNQLKYCSILWWLRFWFEVFLWNNVDYKNYLKSDSLTIKVLWKELFKWTLSEYVFWKDWWKWLVKVEILSCCDTESNQSFFWKMNNWRNNNLWFFYPKEWSQKNLKFKIDLSEAIKKQWFRNLKFNNNDIIDLLEIIKKYLMFLNIFWYIWWKWNLWLWRIQMSGSNLDIDNIKKHVIVDNISDFTVKSDLKIENRIKLIIKSNEKNINLKNLFQKIKLDQNSLRWSYRENDWWRDSIFDNRHKIFWYITYWNKCRACNKEIKWTHWSKLLPWIYKINEWTYSYWFLNISMIKDLSNNEKSNDK